MLAFLLSAFIIVASEMGDKTQLIALCLISSFRKPAPILLGILAATLVSNLAAGLIGASLSSWLHGNVLHIILGLSFLATAVWALIPDKVEECPVPATQHGILLASFWAFLVAEMGDKTQVTALTLAAHFHSAAAVILGTTLGMMAANVPVVLLGNKLLAYLPLKIIRLSSGVLFAALGLYELARLA